MRSTLMSWITVALLAGCGGTASEPATQGDGSATASGEQTSVAIAEDGSDAPDGSLTGTATAWPATDATTAGSCVVSYPDDLEDRAVAFDGTIMDTVRGDPNEDAGATPVDVRVRVHEAFRGNVGDAVTMHTWDFMLPEEDVKGVRILAAADAAMDLMGCGFTRPYSAEEAGVWKDAFTG